MIFACVTNLLMLYTTMLMPRQACHTVMPTCLRSTAGWLRGRVNGITPQLQLQRRSLVACAAPGSLLMLRNPVTSAAAAFGRLGRQQLQLQHHNRVTGGAFRSSSSSTHARAGAGASPTGNSQNTANTSMDATDPSPEPSGSSAAQFLLYTGKTPNGRKTSIYLDELRKAYGVAYKCVHCPLSPFPRS